MASDLAVEFIERHIESWFSKASLDVRAKFDSDCGWLLLTLTVMDLEAGTGWVCSARVSGVPLRIPVQQLVAWTVWRKPKMARSLAYGVREKSPAIALKLLALASEE